MGKQNVAYPYNGILFGNKIKWSTDTCYKMDKPWKHAEWREPDTKDLTLYDSTSLKCPE